MKIPILEYLKTHRLITDGAMGTYYREISDDPLPYPELENLSRPDIIERIHNEYINAGAKLIHTNTHSANTEKLGNDMHFIRDIIKNGINIAQKCTKDKDVYVGAAIGQIPHNDINKNYFNEYKEIIDIFFEFGCNIFIFETFHTLDYIPDIANYVKSKDKNAFILFQFALTDIGVTKNALSISRIITELSNINKIDAIGFNCGIGPTHMFNLMKKLPASNKFISVLPNAGYPEIIDDKVEYVMSPKYFAKMSAKISLLNTNIIGGCCGTTPLHIKLLKEYIENPDFSKLKVNRETKLTTQSKKDNSLKDIKTLNSFNEKLKNNDFIIAVELDPPFKSECEKLVIGAKKLRENGVDIITMADSPMGKARADSILMSLKIKRESMAEVLPHICCRDKNSISLRSSVLGAYIEGIRNMLVVTGDPIPGEHRDEIKSVFDLNSYSLMKMITEMNMDMFAADPIKIGGAANFNVKNKNSEYKRLLKKVENGAEFFLTQPIFTNDTIEFIKNIDKDRNFKIFGGLMPLVTYRNVQFINNEMPGITIPPEYVSKFSPDMTREEAENAGIEIAVEIADKIKPYVDGFYIVAPFNRYEMIIEIIKRLNL